MSGTHASRPQPPGEPAPDEAPSDVEEAFFDDAFLADLEGLASLHKGGVPTPLFLSSNLTDKLATFLVGGDPKGTSITEDAFVALPNASLLQRSDLLVEICRGGSCLAAARAVENFIVFFQALVPTVTHEGGYQIKRFFFRLAPTLIHIAYNDFADDEGKREEGRAALRNLETVLIEIANVRLTPGEVELVFRNIDQMAAFIAVGEYTMSNEVISAQLLQIIRGNQLTRALFRLMEVEVNVQRYLKERIGYLTPQIRVPDDFLTLAEYGPIRILDEETLDGESKHFIQVQIPEISYLRNIVLRMVAQQDGATYDLRLDAVGSAELTVPPATYSLGLVYQP